MSGAKRLVQLENKGKAQVTNADLKEKGTAKGKKK